MNHAITVELQFFQISVLWGVIILLGYDVLRIFRRLIKHDSFFIAVEDMIFWVLASLFIFAMMYRENNGIIRGFSIMGMAIGMVLYHYILSGFIVNLITKLIRTLIRPVAIVLNKGKKLFLSLYKKGKKVAIFIIRRLKKFAKSVKITLNKKKAKYIEAKRKKQEKKAIKKNIKMNEKLARKKSEEEAKKSDGNRKKQKTNHKKQKAKSKKQTATSRNQIVNRNK